MSIYAIGDVQGCYDELMALLDYIHFDEAKDQLWFTGDLVNRGPRSLEVLRFVKALNPAPVIVFGNHDLHLLAVHAGCASIKPNDLFQDVLQAPDGDELMHWLRSQPLLHYDEQRQFLLVHAGIPPQWNLSLALQCAREVEVILHGDDYQEFLSRMYSNQPDLWSEALQGWDRYRYIINALTRMRYCDAQGRLDFKSKGTLAETPQHLIPWFNVQNRQLQQVDVIFGHWAALRGICDVPHLHAIDTGCIWGGTLTALRLEDLKRFSVPKKIIGKRDVEQSIFRKEP
ncbi:MAG: symmetrical bis(5'-nucleosyl)-tetraphosphatase [Pseudomonadota bacterium]